MRQYFYVFSLFLCFILMLSSCRTTYNHTYFRDIPDSLGNSLVTSAIAEYKDPLIRKNDILQVSILTLDPQANGVLSESNAANFLPPNSSSSAVSTPVPGFLVDSNGDIELPIIGKMHVSGLTTTQARDSIHQKVAVYYKKPVVNVRFVNFSITVLGEVTKPGSYTVANEKVSILDAIGMAGDLTIYGKRENVLVIRDSIGHKKFSRIDLGNSKQLQSPYYYLQQGDIIYIEPNKTKLTSSDAAIQARNYALIASVISVLVVIISRL